MLGRVNGKTPSPVWAVDDNHEVMRADFLATEEPLEIRLSPPGTTLSVTMRTPGADVELVTGLLHSEGVIQEARDIARIDTCQDPAKTLLQRQNSVTVVLRQGLEPDLEPLERRFASTSSCGVCGMASIEALKHRGLCRIRTAASVAPAVIYSLPETMRQAQEIYDATGGLHAAGLFDLAGHLLDVREDVGRHNAVDKLVGAALLGGQVPLNDSIVMVSGRTSYEIVQKCIAAGVPIVCAISAPSSLAVSMAQQFGVTLVGFLRKRRFNVYANKDPLVTEARTELTC